MGVDALMYVTTDAPLTDAEILKLAHRIYEAFYGSGLRISDEDGKQVRHCLSRADAEPLDGIDGLPAATTVIQVNTWNRYYGSDGYERGPIHEMLAHAEWLQANVPGGRVFYGSDDSDHVLELTEAYKKELKDHFHAVGHKPYQEHFGSDHKRPDCTFCHEPMVNVGGGGNEDFYSCGGCKQRALVNSRTRTVLARSENKEDWGEMRKTAASGN